MPNSGSVSGSGPVSGAVTFRPRPGLVAQAFPPALAAAAIADWYRFVLEELNGLGTMLRYDRDEAGGAGASKIVARVREIVETLAWDPAAAVAQAWAFAAAEIHEPDDVWAPHLILLQMRAEPQRLRTWIESLPPDAHAFLTPVPNLEET